MILFWIVAIVILIGINSIYFSFITLFTTYIGGFLVITQVVFPFMEKKYLSEANNNPSDSFLMQMNMLKEEAISVNGECSRRFYKYFLKNAIKFAKERKAKVKIIVGNKILPSPAYLKKESVEDEHPNIEKYAFDPKNIGELKKKSLILYKAIEKEIVEFYVLPKRPRYHFSVVDGRHVYWQKPHKSNQTPEKEGIVLDSFFLAITYLIQFKILLCKAKKIEIPRTI